MAKTLKTIVNEIFGAWGDREPSNGERRFISKHMENRIISQFGVKDGKDYAGNSVSGAPYKASNQPHARWPRHGYDPGQDKAQYE